TGPTGIVSQITFKALASITAVQTVTVTATSVEDPTKTGSATIQLRPAGVTVTVSPSTVTLNQGQSQQFTATISGGSGGFTWSISPQVGIIDANTGFYLAPNAIPTTQKITVTATSISDPTKSDTATITLSATIAVGDAAPSDYLAYQFSLAFARNGFGSLVALPPLGIVKKLGTAGYVQEFSDAAKTSGVKYALATQNTTTTAANLVQVFQLLPNLYAYYTTIGPSTAGYPTQDAQQVVFDLNNSFQYDFFDKGYALFAYANTLPAGQNFTVRNNFYTEWTKLGALAGPGRPVDDETAITAITKTTATVQTYESGAVYTITSGPNTNKVFGIIEPIWDLYVTAGGPAGSLGLPTSEVFALAGGLHRQTFEGGALEYTPGGGATFHYPVVAVTVSGASSTVTNALASGASLTLTAQTTIADGTAATDRPISWTTSNGQVIAIQANGASAVVRAAGGGVATVTATSEGVVSAKFNFLVNAPCCQLGAGAPPAIQQSFQAAISRNQIAVELPAAAPAVRAGPGWVQTVQSGDAAPVVYMLAQSDKSGTAYVVAGALLKKYQELGGPAGALGYPVGDATAGGTQRFENASALGGNPVRLVTNPVLAKWAALGYESGAAGDPTGDAAAFATFGANSGTMQAFRNGLIAGATAGPRAGQTWFVTGLILARYTVLGGPAGDFGMPAGDEFVSAGLHQQNFEGGTISYATGDAAAVEHPAARTPAVAVSPATITAGGRARLAVLGFPNNAVIRVSVTGEPDFLVSAASGAYAWEMFIPPASRSGSIAIHAADTKGPGRADGALTVRSAADSRVQIVKVQGDNQSGLPGALLPVSLRVTLRDSSGAGVVGATVVFQASPGAQVMSATAITDANGQAETFVRLPPAEGVALINVDAPSVAINPVTFGVRAAAGTLANFPKLPASDGRGSLLAAAASILRYHQNRGELGSLNGPADVESLNSFLTSYCVAGTQLCDGYLVNPDAGEQVVNLWRAADFTGGVDVSVESATTSAVADLLAQGSPVLLSLALARNGVAAGGHFVTAIGVAADGSIVIQDPNPLFARSSLSDYLAGFSAGGATWTGEVRGAVRFALRSPSATRFLLAAISQPPAVMKNLALEIQSAGGACGIPLELDDAVDSTGKPATGRISRMQACDGTQSVYQVAVGTGLPYRAFVTDLAAGGLSVDLSAATAAIYKVSRPAAALAVSAQTASFTAAGVVNAATFAAGIAPGGLMSIFGSGLSGAGSATAVDIDGVAARMIFATPFQINAEVPATIAPGSHTLRVRSAFGTVEQTVTIASVAPGIFTIGNPPAGAVLNQDYTLNAATNPLPRGQALQIYATGLGAVVRQGVYSVTAAPVTVVLNGTELPAAFAGLAPGFIGLYQVNVVIPPLVAPGLGISLTLKQGTVGSNSVGIALQ
ncbi:MAG TPA: Ig-like domain-containing protein, partial [Bryobacteraceae bacterium]